MSLSKIKCIDWPPYSPDLNPIVNVKEINCKKNIVKRYYDSINLIEAVKSTWDEIDKEVVDYCINSIPGRINDCISINGDKINN